MIEKKNAYGKAAESMVKADLELNGYIVWTTTEQKTCVDLIAETDEGLLHRIQVKSFYTTEDRYDVDIRRPTAKDRYYKKNSMDILALVDIEGKKIAYINFNEVGQKRAIRVWRRNKQDFTTQRYKLPLFFDEHSDFKRIVESIHKIEVV